MCYVPSQSHTFLFVTTPKLWSQSTERPAFFSLNTGSINLTNFIKLTFLSDVDCRSISLLLDNVEDVVQDEQMDIGSACPGSGHNHMCLSLSGIII